MSEHKVETQWMGKMQFNALVNNHVIVMDTPERGGGEDQGSIPKPFVLTALTGCAGMELVALLRKKNITLKDLNVKATGELTKQVPFHYTSVAVVFEIKVENEYRENINNAINQVMSEICGVSFMLRKIMPVIWSVNYL